MNTVFTMNTKTFTLYFFVLINISLVIGQSDVDELPEIILRELQASINANKVSRSLNQAVGNISIITGRRKAHDVFCKTCNLVSDEVIAYRRNGSDDQSMVSYFKKLCQVFTSWGRSVCGGYIKSKLDTILYIIDNKKDLTGQRFCSIYFQTRGCVDPKAKKWDIGMPPKNGTTKQQVSTIETTPLKILHLTDFHYDPLYEPGSNAVCNLPFCCQKSNGTPKKAQDAAGYWGDYHVCDMPWHSITNFTDYLLNKKEKFDVIYYTGDIISHRDWDINQTLNTGTIKKFFRHFNVTFEGTPFYPVLGNHESYPSNLFSPNDVHAPRVSTQWVFDLMAEEWQQWLPPDTEETIRRGGYYTALVRPGFRIIGLNSNFCFTVNLWLVYEDEDPSDQLKWLVDVLSKAEANGERVHILSHIPPGDSECHTQWTIQYRKIVNRFASTITAQFNGHTHYDELRLFRDLENPEKIINVAYNGGSFTTYVGLNPNYRVYDVNQSTYEVEDYYQFTFNLTEANLHPDRSPQWYKLYSFRDAYGLNGTSYENFADLLERMSNDSSLIQKYYRYQGRESAPRLAKECDEACLRQTLCSITSVEANASIQCQFVTENNRTDPNGSGTVIGSNSVVLLLCFWTCTFTFII